ncbi:MAG: 2-phosphosulfolactate phosphatase [Oscillospiraceae bacterium]|nr:2-phosphosulfolactate phosphatase [Oscillospiraceae bacterium]
MDIKILHMVEGAKQARGIAVIIDVFRAFTVETYLMRNNAAKIIPVGDVEIARNFKKRHPDAILCGERKGIIIDGFDYGNCPTDLEKIDLTGKTVVHTTSAGTQGIANASNADEIITGSLVNASAVAEYIKRKNPKCVSLVCMGLMANKQTDEDNLCADYIKSLLENKPLEDIHERMAALKYTSGAKFFDPERQHIFPQRDFELCTNLNSVPFVLRLKKEDDGLNYMERIDIL